MKIRYTEDIYGPSGELVYEKGEAALGCASNGGFADYTYDVQVWPNSYEVIDHEDNLITLNCEVAPNDYLVAECDFEDDGSPIIILSINSGTKMLGGVTFYEEAKVRELIQFLQDVIN